MSSTIYLVRLREAFNRVDYSDTGAKFNTAPNIRFFTSREAADQFAARFAPLHSPFHTQAIDVTGQYSSTATLTVDAMPDEMHWEYYVGVDGTIGNLSEPPEEEYNDAIIPGRKIAEATLILALGSAGLTAPPIDTRTLTTWRDWWDEHVSTMTDVQRAAVWHLFTDNPYLILKVDLEA